MPDTDLPASAAPISAGHAIRRDGVADAISDLIAALKAEALDGDFERTTGYLRKAQDMQARWADGRPSHGPRSGKEG
jgi:hypothetical protein